MRKFEFHAYAGDGTGRIADDAVVTFEEFDETSQARYHAGKLAKQANGPVDLARAGDGPWQDRYITTAAPCEHRASGYRMERLDA